MNPHSIYLQHHKPATKGTGRLSFLDVHLAFIQDAIKGLRALMVQSGELSTRGDSDGKGESGTKVKGKIKPKSKSASVPPIRETEMLIDHTMWAIKKALDTITFDYKRNRTKLQIGRAVQQECRDRSRMPSSA
eukprot:TRINITY_DN44093_c0_g1_i1.p1 TRINITY_DN44093_c0_g1~~TRINITY_DN44093_c0_g1_i1.p1  ORF type:complete len:133 (+),score=14.11 TRINITY_DN44093_c0_g1_i1:91-489(+)